MINYPMLTKMKKNKTKKFIILLLFSCLNIWSQGKWEQGYVVTLSNDTVKGLILFKNKSKTPHEIKIDVKGVIKTYAPIEIRSYTVRMATQDLFFKSVITKLNLVQDNNLYINFSSEPTFITDTIFVQLLVDGKNKLFFHVDNHIVSSHYLMEDNVGNMIDLVYLNYYVNENKIDFASNNLYKTQLITFLTDCNDINTEKINKINFNEADLMALFIAYNNCIDGPKNNYVYKEDKIKCRFGLVAGINQSSLRFVSLDNSLSKTKLDKSRGLNFGLFLNVIFPKTGYRLSFYSEVLFNQYNYTGTGNHSAITGSAYIAKSDVEIKATTLKLFTALRYQTKEFVLNPFIQIGIVNSFVIKSSSITNYYYYKTDFINFRNHEESIFLGIGSNFKKIGIEFRGELGNGMALERDVNSISNYLYFLVNYRF